VNRPGFDGRLGFLLSKSSGGGRLSDSRRWHSDNGARLAWDDLVLGQAAPSSISKRKGASTPGNVAPGGIVHGSTALKTEEGVEPESSEGGGYLRDDRRYGPATRCVP